MKSILLLLVILPAFMWAQKVKPIISEDYLALVRNDSTFKRSKPCDTINNIRSALLVNESNYNGYQISGISIRNNKLTIKPYKTRALFVSGSFSSIAEIKATNKGPQLQNQYVQGRSQNGNLVWQGPETSELFSYGPDINTLEFDGTAYDYDQNGRLVPKGTGNGNDVDAYNNSILRNASFLSQSLSLQAKYKKNYKDFLTASFKTGIANEKTLVQFNKNNSKSIVAVLEAAARLVTITGSYSSQSKNFSNSNRSGFLNRVYQNSLLTPISFGNRQGTILNTGQRSYSRFADNPYFLLQNNPNNFHQDDNSMALSFERKKSPFRFKLTQSLETVKQDEIQTHKPGTAFFENGIISNRLKQDNNYCLQVNAQHDIDYTNYDITSVAGFNYILSSNNSTIEYRQKNSYRYQRISHDASFNFFTKYDQNNIEAGVKLEDKIYISNTTTNSSFFLPAGAAFIRFDNLFDSRVSAKLIGTFNYFNSELPIDQSFAGATLLQYNTGNAFQFFPVTEVESFDHLKPIRHREFSAKAELSYQNKLILNTEVFWNRVNDDVFPISNNSLLTLENIATHKNRGLELELNWYTYKRNFTMNSALSFFKYKSKVVDIKPGYNYTAIAGFNTIHKALVEDQPLGVIVGKAYLKDLNHAIVIDDEGFPLVAPALKIIGDPNPDFIIKFWNNLTCKRFYFNMGWEWKKGGDVWNGAAATLDYYGRSKTSANLRNVSGYIFQGVTRSGMVNSKAVAFYDPALSVTKNRWTRNGFGGIDEEYIQKADLIRINNISISYRITSRKYIQSLLLSIYANNVLVWTAYKGVDPSQLLYDQLNTAGLDFFNLPSLKQLGFSVTFQF